MSPGMRCVGAVCVAGLLAAAGTALGNGGPFVVKYPNGDPAAKGIVARLDPDLKPAREERLRVLKEDLKVTFGDHPLPPTVVEGKEVKLPPLAAVSATYTIENPTDGEIEVDFGFPILRGIYVPPMSMMPRPDVKVLVDGKQNVHPQIISNSAIYGMIRQRAREAIEAAIADDAKLAELVARVRATGMVRARARKTITEAVSADRALGDAVAKDSLLGGLAAPVPDDGGADHASARRELAAHLRDSMAWGDGDVALMVEYASLDFGTFKHAPRDRMMIHWGPGADLMNANLGALAAIGEQKATQFFAVLASRFDPEVASAYESIFTAWGGDVRERSVDLKTGELRPREITVDPKDLAKGTFELGNPATADPTIYARVDYLDPEAAITDAERASCQAVLKDLPVIFTFAPMNLLHYQVRFPAKQTRTLTVNYKQYAYADTREPESYQLAYVVHPASLWKEFGPIRLEVAVPEGVPFRASVPCEASGVEEREIERELGTPVPAGAPAKKRFAVYRTTLTEKTGELFLAVDAKAWKKGPESAEQVVLSGQKVEK